MNESLANVGCSLSTVHNIKLRFAKGERLKALAEKPRSGRPRQVDGEVEAHIIATACSSPPEGRVRWTLQLIAEKVIVLTEALRAVSRASICRDFKKNELKPWLKKEWKIPRGSKKNLSGEWRPS